MQKLKFTNHNKKNVKVLDLAYANLITKFATYKVTVRISNIQKNNRSNTHS